jgi:hypothetical protein
VGEVALEARGEGEAAEGEGRVGEEEEEVGGGGEVGWVWFWVGGGVSWFGGGMIVGVGWWDEKGEGGGDKKGVEGWTYLREASE